MKHSESPFSIVSIILALLLVTCLQPPVRQAWTQRSGLNGRSRCNVGRWANRKFVKAEHYSSPVLRWWETRSVYRSKNRYCQLLPISR